MTPQDAICLPWVSIPFAANFTFSDENINYSSNYCRYVWKFYSQAKYNCWKQSVTAKQVIKMWYYNSVKLVLVIHYVMTHPLLNTVPIQ